MRTTQYGQVVNATPMPEPWLSIARVVYVLVVVTILVWVWRNCEPRRED